MVYFGGHRNSISTQSWSQCLFTHFFLLWRLNLAYLRRRSTTSPSSDFFFSQVLFFSCGWNQMSLAWVAVQLCPACLNTGAAQTAASSGPGSCAGFGTDSCCAWAQSVCSCMALECVCWMPELFVCKISLGVSVLVMSTVWRYCVHLGWFGSSRLSMCLALLNPWGTWLCWRIVTLLEPDYLLPVLPV